MLFQHLLVCLILRLQCRYLGVDIRTYKRSCTKLLRGTDGMYLKEKRAVIIKKYHLQILLRKPDNGTRQIDTTKPGNTSSSLAFITVQRKGSDWLRINKKRETPFMLYAVLRVSRHRRFGRLGRRLFPFRLVHTKVLTFVAGSADYWAGIRPHTIISDVLKAMALCAPGHSAVPSK